MCEYRLPISMLFFFDAGSLKGASSAFLFIRNCSLEIGAKYFVLEFLFPRLHCSLARLIDSLGFLFVFFLLASQNRQPTPRPLPLPLNEVQEAHSLPRRTAPQMDFLDPSEVKNSDGILR